MLCKPWQNSSSAHFDTANDGRHIRQAPKIIDSKKKEENFDNSRAKTKWRRYRNVFDVRPAVVGGVGKPRGVRLKYWLSVALQPTLNARAKTKPRRFRRFNNHTLILGIKFFLGFFLFLFWGKTSYYRDMTVIARQERFFFLFSSRLSFRVCIDRIAARIEDFGHIANWGGKKKVSCTLLWLFISYVLRPGIYSRPMMGWQTQNGL